MLIGIPKEIKPHEYRVSLTPSGVRELGNHGHDVFIETQAGAAIGYTDDHYRAAGAAVVETPEEVYEKSDLIVKVKEPQAGEATLIKEGQVIFCYLHLAAEPKLTEQMMKAGCIAIAFETITSDRGGLPLLAPMSEVAGRVAVQAGVQCLERTQGGKGVLLSGVPGVEAANVTIIGGGVVGINAAMVAIGMGANVVILERSIDRIRELEWRFGNSLRMVYNSHEAIEKHVKEADLVIGAVLIPGAAAPKLVSEELVKQMQPGSVIVDVAVDQGGCVETIRPTTHDEPTYELHGILHYGVSNMPSAVAYTATRALENAILPYTLKLADKGYRSAMKHDEHFRNGLNIYKGHITNEAIASDLNHAFTPASRFINS